MINSGDELRRGSRLDGEKCSVRRVMTDSCELVVATACFNSWSSVETEENACRVGVSWKVRSTSEDCCRTSSS